MSKNATKINRTASKLAVESLRASQIARAKDEAARAKQAAKEAVAAAVAARIAADEAGEGHLAASAAKSADAASASARNAVRKAGEAKGAKASAAAARHVANSLARSAAHAQRTAANYLLSLIDRSACYLVTRNGCLLATFANLDDALLFEAELADLDRAHGEAGVLCEVRDRQGQRMGGYLLTPEKMLNFLRDN